MAYRFIRWASAKLCDKNCEVKIDDSNVWKFNLYKLNLNETLVIDAPRWISSLVDHESEKNHSEKSNRVKPRNNLNHPILCHLTAKPEVNRRRLLRSSVCRRHHRRLENPPRWKIYVRVSVYPFAITGSSHISAGKDVPNEEFTSFVHLHGMVAGCTG